MQLLFHKFEFFITNNQTYHLYFRNYIYNYIIDHEEEITKEYTFINVEDNIIPMKEYIKNITVIHYAIREKIL